MIEEHTEEAAVLYVLGMLPEEEIGKFEAILAGDAELADLIYRLEETTAALAWTAPPRTPPAALRARIMANIREERAPKKLISAVFETWLPWAAAACLAVTTAKFGYDWNHLNLLVDSFTIRDRMQQAELDRAQSREVALASRLKELTELAGTAAKDKSALEAQVQALRGDVAQLKTRDALSNIKIATLASMLKGAPHAMAIVAWDGVSQRGILKPLNFPPAGEGKDYQLWIIDPAYSQPVSAGLINATGRADFQPLHPISKVSKFAVSLEKKGGSPAPQGPIVLVGE